MAMTLTFPGWRFLGKIGCGFGCLAAVVLLIVGGPGLIFGLALWAASERTVYSRVASPNGSQEARVQFDDCGAPCGWAKVVFVKSRWMPSDTPRLSCPAFWGDGTDKVRLEWSGNFKLIVNHGFGTDSFDAAKTCGPVSIIPRYDPALVSTDP